MHRRRSRPSTCPASRRCRGGGGSPRTSRAPSPTGGRSRSRSRGTPRRGQMKYSRSKRASTSRLASWNVRPRVGVDSRGAGPAARGAGARSSGPSLPNASATATTLRSSRTLPGQSWRIRRSSESLVDAVVRRPCRPGVIMRRTSTGMSSSRWRSEGSSTVSCATRKYRSLRNLPALHLAHQVAPGRRDDAHVDLTVRVRRRRS